MNNNETKEPMSKKQRRDDKSSAVVASSMPKGGWKKYPEFPYSGPRAFPGNPDRERCKAYYLPYACLSTAQRQVASVILGAVDEDSWEKATPRRLWSRTAETVIQFQSKTWEQLSQEEQKDAMNELELTKEVWNDTFSAYHDDHWVIPTITMKPDQFDVFLRMLDRVAERRGITTKKSLAEFLLQTEKVFTPSQALAMVRTLKKYTCWDVLQADSTLGSGHALVASFVTDTHKLAGIDALFVLGLWDDESSGCVWGNFTAPEPLLVEQVPQRGRQQLPTYAAALRNRRDRSKALRHEAAAVLSGSYGNRSVLPSLDRSLVLDILNTYVGHGPSIDPRECTWPKCYEDAPVLDALSPPSTTRITRYW